MCDDFFVQIQADALFDCGNDRLSDQDRVRQTDDLDLQDSTQLRISTAINSDGVRGWLLVSFVGSLMML